MYVTSHLLAHQGVAASVKGTVTVKCRVRNMRHDDDERRVMG